MSSRTRRPRASRPRPPSMSDISAIDELSGELWPLCERLARRLRRNGFAARGLTLKLKTGRFPPPHPQPAPAGADAAGGDHLSHRLAAARSRGGWPALSPDRHRHRRVGGRRGSRHSRPLRAGDATHRRRRASDGGGQGQARDSRHPQRAAAGARTCRPLRRTTTKTNDQQDGLSRFNSFSLPATVKLP